MLQENLRNICRNIYWMIMLLFLMIRTEFPKITQIQDNSDMFLSKTQRQIATRAT